MLFKCLANGNKISLETKRIGIVVNLEKFCYSEIKNFLANKSLLPTIKIPKCVTLMQYKFINEKQSSVFAVGRDERRGRNDKSSYKMAHLHYTQLSIEWTIVQ